MLQLMILTIRSTMTDSLRSLLHSPTLFRQECLRRETVPMSEARPRSVVLMQALSVPKVASMLREGSVLRPMVLTRAVSAEELMLQVRMPSAAHKVASEIPVPIMLRATSVETSLQQILMPLSSVAEIMAEPVLSPVCRTAIRVQNQV